ncbi:hypothetical protein ACFQX8_10575 [Klenkia terrae]|uniref:hypothetical protein n=1 Tax=Klenkia terrae TaxID=1052259 RepID=UPI00361D3FA8
MSPLRWGGGRRPRRHRTPRPPLPYPAPGGREYPPPLDPQPLGDRVTPQQLLLGAGVVAVLGSVLSTFTVGTPAGVVAVSVLLLVAAALGVLAGHAGSPTAGEALAVGSVLAAAALVVVGARTAPDPELAAGTLVLFVAVGTGALALVSPQLRTWRVSCWVAAQVAVLVAVRAGDLPSDLLAGALLGVALTGLAIAWFADGVVALSGLLCSVPWWVVGVWVAERAAWSGDRPAVAALLATGAAVGLLVTTHEKVPELPWAGLPSRCSPGSRPARWSPAPRRPPGRSGCWGRGSWASDWLRWSPSPRPGGRTGCRGTPGWPPRPR